MEVNKPNHLWLYACCKMCDPHADCETSQNDKPVIIIIFRIYNSQILSYVFQNRRNTFLSHSDRDIGLMYLKSMGIVLELSPVDVDLHVQ